VRFAASVIYGYCKKYLFFKWITIFVRIRPIGWPISQVLGTISTEAVVAECERQLFAADFKT
jgi:hypothetical protein